MSPAYKTHSRTLFTTAAALVLGLQVAPWPLILEAQENAPAPLIVQAQARPIPPTTNREQRQFNNAQRPAPPAQPAQQPPAPQNSGVPQAPKSEVQKELEKLYVQNGRAVPEMVDPNFSQPPSGQSGVTSPPAPAAQAQMPSQAPHHQAAPVSAPKKKGLFAKLFGSKNEGPTQPPVEPPYVPPSYAIPVTPPARLSAPRADLPAVPLGNQPTAPPVAPPGTSPPNYSQLFTPPGQTAGAGATQQPPAQPPLLLSPAQPQQSVQAPAAQAQNTLPAPVAPANDGFEAPLFVEPPAENGAGSLPAIDFSTPLVEPDTVDLGPAAQLPVAKPVEPADPFSDAALFPGAAVPTTAAPAVVPNSSVAVEAAPVEPIPPAVESSPPAAEEIAVDENPYSGLKLEADPFSSPSTLQAAPVAPREIPIDEPVAPAEPFEARETVETVPPALMIPPSDKGEVPPDVSLDEQPEITEPPARRFSIPNPEESREEPPLVVEEPEVKPPTRLPPAPRPTDERTQAKQEMIAARKGLKGLKGFCAVVLREDRDLVDAHSQFRVIHNGKTYYLSSSQAVSAFHSDPAKYAPAARGCDVIQQAITGEEMEGSLDFAVWYKGRLYLFTSAETMDTFVSAPGSHATLE